jgi:diacylglycerol kinase family enzyme
MHRALLIYNPSSGRKRARRAEKIARAAEVLRSAGVTVDVCATRDAGTAIVQTQNAVVAGFDTIIACGGDGTVHEVLNGLMLIGPGAGVSLGVIPLGSGNLLATDLGVPRNPEAAARALLSWRPVELHPGVMSYRARDGQQKRWFIIAAGVGADAQLMYRTAVEVKERYGYYAYFMEMARMTLRRDLPKFQVEWNDAAGNRHSEIVTLVLSTRATRFPGLMWRVRLDCELTQPCHRIMIFKTDRVLDYMNFFASLITGWNWKVPQIDLDYSSWFRCTALESAKNAIHCEADGELLGTLPVEVGIEERTFTLLMP